MRKLIPGLTAAALTLGFTLWAWSRLPAEVATHWGMNGEPDGWSSKPVLFVLPAMLVLLALLFMVLPRIDPRRAHYELHARTYWLVANSSMVFLAVLGMGVVAFNLGWTFPLARLVQVGAGVLFVIIGNVMTRVRSNWFLGFRTPWTLASEDVWRRTHRLGGRTMVIGGLLLAVAGLVLPARQSFIVLMVVAVMVGLLPLVYSYILWRREQEGATTPSTPPS